METYQFERLMSEQREIKERLGYQIAILQKLVDVLKGKESKKKILKEKLQ